jgi:hypothetical protein
MTAEQFRSLALSLPEASESAHMGHPDFRVGGRIFATLGHPRRGWAMIKLPPEDQRFLVRTRPACFRPAPGAWGRSGSTHLQLRLAPKGVVRDALAIAWRAQAPKRLAARLE